MAAIPWPTILSDLAFMHMPDALKNRGYLLLRVRETGTDVLEHLNFDPIDEFFSDESPFARGFVKPSARHVTLASNIYFDSSLPTDRRRAALKDLAQSNMLDKPLTLSARTAMIFSNKEPISKTEYHAVVIKVELDEHLCHVKRMIERGLPVFNIYPPGNPHVTICYLNSKAAAERMRDLLQSAIDTTGIEFEHVAAEDGCPFVASVCPEDAL